MENTLLEIVLTLIIVVASLGVGYFFFTIDNTEYRIEKINNTFFQAQKRCYCIFWKNIGNAYFSKNEAQYDIDNDERKDFKWKN